jgi:hypothetical protein
MFTKHMVKSSQYDSIIQPKCNIAEISSITDLSYFKQAWGKFLKILENKCVLFPYKLHIVYLKELINQLICL